MSLRIKFLAQENNDISSNEDKVFCLFVFCKETITRQAMRINFLPKGNNGMSSNEDKVFLFKETTGCHEYGSASSRPCDISVALTIRQLPDCLVF